MCVLLLPIFCLLLSCMSPHYSQSYSHTTSFIFHEANKYQRDATRMKQQGGEWKDEDISLTLLRYWIEPCLKSTFSLGFAIKTNYFSFFIIFLNNANSCLWLLQIVNMLGIKSFTAFHYRTRFLYLSITWKLILSEELVSM